ncbi:MAG: hypothetical protein RLZZ156_1098 [Deinococcota bacterium]|jgi:RNAse (barnase) inhibitor barstar
MTVLEQLKKESGVIRGRISISQKLELEAHGYVVLTIDRAPVFNKETLLHGIYQAGMFPAYFGFNWDALRDCLTDFSWLTAPKGIILVLQNSALLEARDNDSWLTLLEMMAEVSALRATQALKPLYLLV